MGQYGSSRVSIVLLVFSHLYPVLSARHVRELLHNVFVVCNLSFARHVRGTFYRIHGILLVPGAIVSSGNCLVVALRSHILVGTVHAKSSTIGICD